MLTSIASSLGIGSGINSLMLALDWQSSLITNRPKSTSRQPVGRALRA